MLSTEHDIIYQIFCYVWTFICTFIIGVWTFYTHRNSKGLNSRGLS